MHLEVHLEDWVLCRVVAGGILVLGGALLLLGRVLGDRLLFVHVWVVERLITLWLRQHLRDEFTLQFLTVLNHVAQLRCRRECKITINLRLLFSWLNLRTTTRLIHLRCRIRLVEVDLKSGLVWRCLIPISWNFSEQIFDLFEVFLKLLIVGLVTAVWSMLILLFDRGFGLVVGGPEFQHAIADGPMAHFGRVLGLLNGATIVLNVAWLIGYLGNFVAILCADFFWNTPFFIQRHFILNYSCYVSFLVKECNLGCVFGQILLTIIAGNDRIIANVFI